MRSINNELLESIFNLASEGIIVTDSKNNIIYYNDTTAQILEIGQPPKTNITDYLPVGKRLLNERGEHEVWVGDKAISLRVEIIQADNKSQKIFFLSDITSSLQEKERLLCLNAIIESVQEGITAVDANGKVFLYNNQLAKIEGLSKEEVLNKHYFDVWGLPAEESFFYSVFINKKPRIDEPWYHLNYTGQEVKYLHSSYPVLKDGKVRGVYCITRNVFWMRQFMMRTAELQNKFFPSGAGENLNNGTRFTFRDIIGETSIIKETVNQSIKAAQTSAPVMIIGETGTGKELFVQSIHNSSLNSEEPFIPVNCAAIPESLLESILFGTVKGAFTGAENSTGLFEQAGKGTLFLDEINSMPMTLQAKILRVIQEKSVRRIGSNTEVPIYCRIISSSNEDPWQCVCKGLLRQDLFYRLTGICLHIPPLRERGSDIELLANFFLKKYSRLIGMDNIKISDSVLQRLISHAWPGNVRELEHVIEGAVAMMEPNEEFLLLHHLPLHFRNNLDKNKPGSLQGLKLHLRNLERDFIVNALQNNNWNISHTAKALEIGRQNLQYKIQQLNISKS